MKINIEINDDNDVRLIRKIACLIASVPEKEAIESTPEVLPEKTPEILPEETPEETPEVIEEPVVEKPKAKRSRKKKEEPAPEILPEETPESTPEETPAEAVEEPTEVETPTTDEIKAAAAKEEPAEDSNRVTFNSELPFDDGEDEGLPADMKPQPKCTLEQWRVVRINKMIELGLVTKDGGEGPLIARRSQFTDLVHKISEDYGDRIPSKLNDEKRYEFIQQFNRIEWDEETKNYQISSAPF